MTPGSDPGNMREAIFQFPEQIETAMEIGDRIRLKHAYSALRNLVIAGMGGSAIGGDVVRALVGREIPVPMAVSRHYRLPAWVDRHTLVICSSYSGNTEETLAAYQEAERRGARLCGLSTGGTLTEWLQASGRDLISIPGGLQPRAALAYSFVVLLYLLQAAGVITNGFVGHLERTVALLKHHRERYSGTQDNPCLALAQRIARKIPVIYGETERTALAALRWKGQLCENAKMLAYHNELPEMNHNEIVGWENNAEVLKNLFVIWLSDPDDHPRVARRREISRGLLQEYCDHAVIQAEGEQAFERLVHLIHFGDWVSYWCAIVNGSDPTPVKKIDLLKSRLRTDT